MAEAVALNKMDPLGEIDGINLICSRFPSLPPDHLAYHKFLQSLPVKNANLLVEEGNEILKNLAESAPTITSALTEDIKEEPMHESQQNSPGRSKVYEYKHWYPSDDASKLNGYNCEETANNGKFGSNRSLEELDSLPVVMGKITEVPIDIEKIKDPRELFEAFERRKRAQKELARITGRPLPNQQRKIRPRKPNIPGQSKVYEYKHRYPLSDSPKVEQDKREENNVNDAVESIVKKGDEKQSGCAVDALGESTQKKTLSCELLDSKAKDLEEERELNNLIEQLKVKPFEADKVNILHMPEIKRVLVDDAGNVPRKKPLPLSDIQNMFHNVIRRKRKSSDNVSDAPTPPKSPSASVSALWAKPSNFVVDALGKSPRRKLSTNKLLEHEVINLEEQTAVNYPQEHLKVAPFKAEKLDEIHKTIVVPNEISQPLSDMQNMFLDSRKKRKSFDLKSIDISAPSSPFASLSALGKSIAKKSKSSDHFEFSDEQSYSENAPQGGRLCKANPENDDQTVVNLEFSPPTQSEYPLHVEISSAQKPPESSPPNGNLVKTVAFQEENSILRGSRVIEPFGLNNKEGTKEVQPLASDESNVSVEFNFMKENEEGSFPEGTRANEPFDFNDEGDPPRPMRSNEPKELSVVEEHVDAGFSVASFDIGSSPNDTEFIVENSNRRRRKAVSISSKRKVKRSRSDETRRVSGSDSEKDHQESLNSAKGFCCQDQIEESQSELNENEEDNRPQDVAANGLFESSDTRGNAGSKHNSEAGNSLGQKQANKKGRKQNAAGKPRKRAGSDQSQPVPTNDLEKGQQDTVARSTTSQSMPPDNLAFDNNCQKKRKNMKMRNSLAGAGTCFESGERRSTRIRSKPLQYWKGERFLYGRVHQSLVTVIGIKEFDSPGNNTLKVKSFVSEEYSDMLKSAAIW